MKLTHYDETKKMAHDSQIFRVEENLKVSYSIIIIIILFCFTVQQILTRCFQRLGRTVNPYKPSAFLWVIATQLIPRSDAAEYGVWSLSPLIVYSL